MSRLAGLAPYTEEFDWFAGMVAPGGLRAALAGREARAAYAETDEFDERSFTAADWAALEAPGVARDDAMRAARPGRMA